MKNKRVAPIIIAAAGILLLLIAGICVKNRDNVPRILGDSNAPQTAVTGFFDALCEGDYELCAEYVSGYSELGLDRLPEKESERMIYNALLESYGCQLLGDIEVTGDGVRQRVLMTALDVGSMSDDISAEFMPTIERIMADFSDYDAMFDENGQYSELLIEETLCDILGRLLETPERYYSTQEMALELEFVGGEWKLMLSDRLVSVLTGGAGEEE